MKFGKFLIKCIDFYRKRISWLKRPSCVFFPTCSEYARQAIQKHGTLRGIRLSFFRILRCHPWQNDHMDPVP